MNFEVSLSVWVLANVEQERKNFALYVAVEKIYHVQAEQ